MASVTRLVPQSEALPWPGRGRRRRRRSRVEARLNEQVPEPDRAALNRGFRLARRLGTGEFEVFLAHDENLGRLVALKLLRKESDDAERQFLLEASAAAASSIPMS